MSPHLEDHQKPESPTDEIDEHINRLDLSSSEATTSSSESESNHVTPVRHQGTQIDGVHSRVVEVPAEEKSYVPLEQNLKELLLKVADTEDLETVTQIKLRVIAREVTLQQLGHYLPALRELILDGSVISSLRDLGNGLKNLKVLKVNNCQLACIDAVFGFESLEELYAADNDIKDISPCALINFLKTLDVRRNDVKHITALGFLGLCQDLDHLYIEGNNGVTQFPRYREAIKVLLPRLKSLDGVEYTLDEMMQTVINTETYLAAHPEIYPELQENPETEASFTPQISRSDLHRNRPTPRNASEGFTVSFPPRLFSGGRNNAGNPGNT